MQNLLTASLICACLITTGCTFHPLGINDDQWQSMSHDERLNAYNKQAEIDKEAQKAHAQEMAVKAEQAREIRQTLEERRSEAHYGDIVQCAISPLSVHQSGDKWQTSQGVSTELVRGEIRPVQTLINDYTRQLWFAFDDAGHTLALCKNRPQHTAYGIDFNRAQCAVIHTTTKALHRGFAQKLGENKHFKGYVRCDLAPHRH